MFVSKSFERSVTEKAGGVKKKNGKTMDFLAFEIGMNFCTIFPLLAQCARGYWHEGEAHISSFSLPRGKMYPAF